MLIKDEPGTVKEVCDLMRTADFKCVSLLTTYQDVQEGFRELIIRFQANEKDIDQIMKKLTAKYDQVELINE